ncbi:MAG: exo-alpha-sialidase [Kiritimatiellia bacterium]|jgi:hypothetical protein
MKRLPAFFPIPFLAAALIAAPADAADTPRAMLAPGPLAAAELTPGALLFRDRSFALGSIPDALKGELFLRGSFHDGSAATVERAGALFVLSPAQRTSNVSQEKALRAAGFVRDDSVAPFQAWGRNLVDVATVWRKEVEAGETFAFGKWAVIFGFDGSNLPVQRPTARNRALAERLRASYPPDVVSGILSTKPDFAVYIPKRPERRWEQVKAGAHDTYNDHFQVIRDDPRGVFHAFWTQATLETAADHHTAYSRSVDGGLTWSEPRALAGSMTTNRAERVDTASWQQPMLSRSGRLYCLWSPADKSMAGIYSDDGGLTWSEPEKVPIDLRTPGEIARGEAGTRWWCNWQRPLRLGRDGRFLVGSSRAGGCEIWEYENIDDDPPVRDIRISRYAVGDDMLRVEPDAEGKAICEEPSLMKLPDGRLFAVMRASGGSPVWSASADDGRTWSKTEPLLVRDGGSAIAHSVSPCPCYDWKGPEAASGLYFGLFHLEVTDHRGPLYLVPGRYVPGAHQPVAFDGTPKLVEPNTHWNSYYTSYTMLGDEGVLWYPGSAKYYLLGRVVSEDYMK